MPVVDQSRQPSLDALRVAALFGVVAIHASFQRSGDALGFYLDEAGRFAVPVFFILSAYFWRSELVATPFRLAARVAGRVWLALAVFMALNIGLAWVLGTEFTLDLSPTGLFLVVWNGDPVAHYLWFLPALVVGTLLTALGLRYFGFAATLALSLMAYAFGCAIGAYGEILLGEEQPIWLYRNGVLFAPVFMVIGVALRQQWAWIERVPFAILALAPLLTFVLQVVEGRLLGRTHFGHDFGLATVPYAVAMVLLFMRLPIRNPLWILLGRASFGAYLIHFPLLTLVDALGWPSLSLLELVVDCGVLSLVLAVLYQFVVGRFAPRTAIRASRPTDPLAR